MHSGGKSLLFEKLPKTINKVPGVSFKLTNISFVFKGFKSTSGS